MSVFAEAFQAFRDVLLLQSAVKALSEDVKAMSRDVMDHESRLVRLETIEEMSGARPRMRRLPPPRE